MTNVESAMRKALGGGDDILGQLRLEAKRNKVFKDMCYTFSIRERARDQVTLDNLVVSMRREGFKHSRFDYSEALKFLARLGLGTLKLGKKNEVIALTNVRYKLQSIGLAAIDTKEGLEKFKSRVVYDDIAKAPPIIADKPVDRHIGRPNIPHRDNREVSPVRADDIIKYQQQRRLTVPVNINGNLIDFDLPRALTQQELVEVLSKLYEPK